MKKVVICTTAKQRLHLAIPASSGENQLSFLLPLATSTADFWGKLMDEAEDTKVLSKLDDTHEHPQLFTCPICLDSCPRQEVFVPSGCSHEFCRECARGVVLNAVRWASCSTAQQVSAPVLLNPRTVLLLIDVHASAHACTSTGPYTCMPTSILPTQHCLASWSVSVSTYMSITVHA